MSCRHKAYILHPARSIALHNVAEKHCPNTNKPLLVMEVDLIDKALQCCIKPV